MTIKRPDILPDLADVCHVFSHDKYLSATGNHFITLVQFTTIYGIDGDVLPPVLRIDSAPYRAPAEVL